jgi:hypothetical protein
MTTVVYQPYATATINGTAINTQLLKGARVEMSFSDPVSKGYVKCIGAPGWAQGDDVTITLGGGSNNVTRFPQGSVWQGDYLNTGPNFELVCRGPLYAVEKYRNNRAKGLTLTDLTGGAATDEDITKAVLDIVGVSYSAGNIGGTGIMRGTLAPDAYTWRQGEGALEYLQRLSKASVGYKLVESFGVIYRTQVFGIPSGPPDFALTEGVDIFEGGHTQRETFSRYTAWEVTGYNYGSGNGAVRFANPDPIPNGVQNYAYSSDMIERARNSDPGAGISCEAVEAYIQAETDHEITHISGLQTPRDILIGPGQIGNINAPMLGVNGQLLGVLSVTAETDENWFIQTLELIG